MKKRIKKRVINLEEKKKAVPLYSQSGIRVTTVTHLSAEKKSSLKKLHQYQQVVQGTRRIITVNSKN